MEVDVETGFNVENPLHVDNIPVANLVVIEVEGQPIPEPKSTPIRDACIKLRDYIQLSGAVLMLLAILGGMFLFLIWMCDPLVFGGSLDD
jgi:hypothetical protein